jgi:hypothetical protein
MLYQSIVNNIVDWFINLNKKNIQESDLLKGCSACAIFFLPVLVGASTERIKEVDGL